MEGKVLMLCYNHSPEASLSFFIIFFFPFHHRRCTTWKWKISFQFHYLCFTILPFLSEQVMSCTPNHRTTLFPELPGKHRTSASKYSRYYDMEVWKYQHVFIQKHHNTAAELDLHLSNFLLNNLTTMSSNHLYCYLVVLKNALLSQVQPLSLSI